MSGAGDFLGIGAFLVGAVDEFYYSDEEKAQNATLQEQAKAGQADALARVEQARIEAESRKQTVMTGALLIAGLGLGFLAYRALEG